MGEDNLKLVLVTSSVHSLDVRKASTSSELFSLNLMLNLSSFFDETYIFSDGTTNFERDEDKRITLYPFIKTGKYSNNLKQVIEQVVGLKQKKNSNIVFFIFGYNYFTLRKLRGLCKLYSAKLISFTFDTHKVGTENLKGMKKLLLENFHELGIRTLNKIDGIILFQKAAYEELGLNIPYLVTKVGTSKESISNYQYQRSTQRFKLLYAGSLEKYNCIDVIIESMNVLSKYDVELVIYGDGSLRKYCELASEKSERIKYLHVVDKATIDAAIRDADLLLNIRDVNSIVCKYAFPSKLIEYMSSGVPVLSTRVISDLNFDDAVYVVDDFSPTGIASLIKKILENPDDQIKRSFYAKKYVAEFFSWNNISMEIYDFIKKTVEGDNGK